ncbi:MAG: uroporphyrinogen-III C-methyltransferase [Planctomycetota bacterium]|nr:uroporphyrinogen-III C-methyltransferase [Planctomycetota bacterium]
MSSKGAIKTVALIGAGPGDPGLITVRGARLLELAEFVVYDHLSNPRLLSYCPQAETIYVGKKAAAHSMSQEQINAMLVEKAQSGKRVVRLKGGDPFVFGRGGEECEALAAAGIPFEVVPGVTSAIAAAAYAGIPVTHRDLNSSFTLITGHEKEEEDRAMEAKGRGAASGSSDIRWDAIAKLPCVAFYMGVGALGRICQKLLENGMAPQMPAAMIQWGTMPNQRTVVSTLEKLATESKLGSPAITIFGKVVSLRETISWFERRPLFGQTVLVTRTRHQASELSEQLEELGAAVIEAPTIEIAPPADPASVDAALLSAAKYDWIVFTSTNGVTTAKDRLLAAGKDIRVFGQAKIAAIGDATAHAIQRALCLKVDLCPKEFVAEALVDELLSRNQVIGQKFLLLRAEIARPLLRNRLSAIGAAEVNDVPLYQTHPVQTFPPGVHDAIDAGNISWITFTSSSTAKNFIQLLGPGYKQKISTIKLASIGPITTATLREAGIEPTVEAAHYNLDGLIRAIVDRSTSKLKEE